MWIETERNSKLFTDDGDSAYEQVGWHIQRGGSFLMPGVTAMALAPDNVIIITKYIKFAKAHANPDDLFKDADIEYKMNKLPHDGGGAYYICDLSIAIGEGAVPEKYNRRTGKCWQTNLDIVATLRLAWGSSGWKQYKTHNHILKKSIV